MEHLSAEVIVKMFSPKSVINIVKEGIKKYSAGNYHVPERMHIKRGASTNLIMPAFGEDYYCTKLISVDPNNHNHHLPIISGMLILNNTQTGEFLVSMDAPMITALRTAAIGSIGLDLIGGQNIEKLGVIGLGVQGYWQTVFAVSTREITEIYCFSRSEKKFNSYQKQITARFPHVSINWCRSAEEVVEASEVIISCTTSILPVFQPKGLDLAHKRFVSIGSFTKAMQELPDEVYCRAEAMVLDTESAKLEVGDVINTLKNEWIPSSNIFTLADIIGGKKSISKYKNIVFKSVGMAAFDLALSVAVYEQHKLKNT